MVNHIQIYKFCSFPKKDYNKAIVISDLEENSNWKSWDQEEMVHWINSNFRNYQSDAEILKKTEIKRC